MFFRPSKGILIDILASFGLVWFSWLFTFFAWFERSTLLQLEKNVITSSKRQTVLWQSWLYDNYLL